MQLHAIHSAADLASEAQRKESIKVRVVPVCAAQKYWRN